MFSVAVWICIIGILLSFVGMVTTERVSNMIAPRKEGFLAIPRTILSMIWLVGGQIFCLVVLMSFLLVLALIF
tara:strand:- start:73 stop:291 length:219 start_codon:yes stop_codon:yes gene_type:complete